MRVLTAFYGCNRAFREWLAVGMPANVICLEEHRQKKTTVLGKTATRKKTTTNTTSSIPDGVA